ncbi:MAG: DUF4845 domain-containing protein [Pseudogulbenkiania sp.]|nr:DUF4845 domain-containing protein [Pseudogulbenkiania sp.]
MQRGQNGFTIISTLVLMAFIGGVILLGFKVVPVYVEYAAVKQAVRDLGSETSSSEYQIRKNFNTKADVGDISSIRGQDLQVVAGSGIVHVRAAYRREVPLFANVGLIFDFETEAGKTDSSQ